ncbi:MAG: TraR/DksA family transcriptional regulator [Gammaproteobacteria bacterium]|nr:TraR/DksA family transcriptional regulator [Gammaproteobacteria bacterium]MCP5417849.1 TraR/DksA family transcriptional regulator [Chromatiaceae bacterium]
MKKYAAIRQKLLQRRELLVKRMQEIAQQQQRAEGPLSQDFAEQATEREHEEVLDALGEAGRLELSQINRTLERIDSDEYGICAECGEPIAEARLEVLPNSEYCISCAERHDH